MAKQPDDDISPTRHPQGETQPTHLTANYTQIKILFESSAPLPPPEVFNQFSPEVQKEIMARVHAEQQLRHQFLLKQQDNDHALNMERERHHFEWRRCGTRTGGVVLVAALAVAGLLVRYGAPVIATTFFLIIVVGAIGTAIHAHRHQPNDEKNKNRLRSQPKPIPESKMTPP